MSLAPLEVVVLAFPGTDVASAVRSTLDRAEQAGDVRVVDALVVTKDSAGTTSVTEFADHEDLKELADAYGLADAPAAGMIAGADADEVGELLEPGSTGVAVLVEHLWARDLADAVRAAGGLLVASVRVPQPHVLEALRRGPGGAGTRPRARRGR